jgi:hypothetical protein
VVTAARQPLHAEGCLFCRQSDGGFSSREHVLSEAFGNEEYILPPGVVCDRCNNGALALIDEALVNFPPITLLRGERGLPSKAGKAVASKWGNATLFWGPERGTLNVEGSRKLLRNMETDGTTSKGTFTLTTGGPITAKRIGRLVRSIWKSTLEFVYLDHGSEIAFHHVFDGARTAIIEEGSHGWALMVKDSTPTESVELTYERRNVQGRPALPTLINIFGVTIMTDPLLRDWNADEVEAGVAVNVWKF